MESKQQFKGLLLGAQQGDNQKRKECEQAIQQMQQTDLPNFIQNLTLVVTEVAETEAHANIRELSAILFKNTVRVKSRNFVESKWFQLDQSVRNGIREALFGSIGGEAAKNMSLPFMKDLCACISAIAIVEIPTGNWSEYVEILAGWAVRDDNQHFKMAGILNLGNIQEELEATDLSERDL